MEDKKMPIDENDLECFEDMEDYLGMSNNINSNEELEELNFDNTK